MKIRFTISVILLLLVFAFGLASPLPCLKATNNDTALISRSNNEFAFDLYSVLSKEKGNLFFSPYSISSALAMTYAGARGETANQMAKSLHYDIPSVELNSGFSDLMKQFNTSGKGYQLAVANTLWGQKGTTFYPAFIEVTQKYYQAGFKEVDYRNHTEQARNTINNWVEAKTNHKIVELLKLNILTNLTRLVLTNAIYFKGKWNLQFDPKWTSQAPFCTLNGAEINVPLMYQLGKFKYYETNDTQIIELPYRGGKVAMDILLPKSQSNLAELESNLRISDLQSILNKMTSEKVMVYLPRFKMEKELSLKSVLQNLGMRDAFDENAANFSGISKTFLYISHVVHKAFVEVNEEGTEAAAATGVVMDTKSAPMQPVVFRADHPFFFVIRDLQSGCILFIGRMVEPR